MRRVILAAATAMIAGPSISQTSPAPGLCDVPWSDACRRLTELATPLLAWTEAVEALERAVAEEAAAREAAEAARQAAERAARKVEWARKQEAEVRQAVNAAIGARLQNEKPGTAAADDEEMPAGEGVAAEALAAGLHAAVIRSELSEGIITAEHANIAGDIGDHFSPPPGGFGGALAIKFDLALTRGRAFDGAPRRVFPIGELPSTLRLLEAQALSALQEAQTAGAFEILPEEEFSDWSVLSVIFSPRGIVVR